MARDDGKHFFGAIPGRTVNDARLSALHFRVLMAIAGRDRMNRNGQGCWASQATLARQVNCYPTRLSEAVSDLLQFGYITVHRSDHDARRKGYRVVYDDVADSVGMGAVSSLDGEVFRRPKASPNGDVSRPNNSSRSSEVSGRVKGSPSGEVSARDTSPKGDISPKVDSEKDIKNNLLTPRPANLIYSVETEYTPRSSAGEYDEGGELRAKIAAKLGKDGWAVLLHLTEDDLQELVRLESFGGLGSAQLASARQRAAEHEQGRNPQRAQNARS